MGLVGGDIGGLAGEAYEIDKAKLGRQKAALAAKRVTWELSNRYPEKVAQAVELENALSALVTKDTRQNRERALDAILTLHGSDQDKLAKALRS